MNFLERIFGKKVPRPEHGDPRADTPRDHSRAGVSSEAKWTPLDPDIPCRMPFSALRQIFVFTSDSQELMLEWPMTIMLGILQDAVERPLSDIVGKVPWDSISGSDVGEVLMRERSIPQSAWDAMSAINPIAVQRLMAGEYKVCVRNFHNENTGKKGALFLVYDKRTA